MADLAVSCEYLTSDKTCLAVFESAKAKAVRQVRCENFEKMSCCYTCLFKRKCAIGCTYLGSFEIEPQNIRDEKNEEETKSLEAERVEKNNSEKPSLVNCPSCNLPMCQTNAKINVNSDDLGQLEKELLPITVHICLKCGKIEFAANEETKRKLSPKSS